MKHGIVPDIVIGASMGAQMTIAVNLNADIIGMAEFDRAAELIEEGAAAIERRLPQIHDALSVLARSLPHSDTP